MRQWPTWGHMLANGLVGGPPVACLRGSPSGTKRPNSASLKIMGTKPKTVHGWGIG